MASSSKVKGSQYEREIVNQAKEIGLEAIRAYASNGLSLGKCEAVDLIISGITVQAKRRAKLASYMKIPDGVDVVVMREDRGESLAVIPLTKLLQLIKDGKYE